MNKNFRVSKSCAKLPELRNFTKTTIDLSILKDQQSSVETALDTLPEDNASTSGPSNIINDGMLRHHRNAMSQRFVVSQRSSPKMMILATSSEDPLLNTPRRILSRSRTRNQIDVS